jgi:hypothetical protein
MTWGWRPATGSLLLLRHELQDQGRIDGDTAVENRGDRSRVRDPVERIRIEEDQVGDLSRRDRAESILLAERPGVVQGRATDRGGRRKARFDE